MADRQDLICVNGRQQPLTTHTLAALLDDQGMAGHTGVAVALNGAVVARADWSSTPVASGDVVEIVVAKQGG